MKKWMAAGMLLVLLAGGCDEPGDQVEMEVGKPVEDYEPKETDIVNTHGNVENLERFDEFYENAQSGMEDNIRIVYYTEEGDPILQDLSYDGMFFKSITDSRRDKFGEGELIIMTCTNIEYSTTNDMADNVYKLTECGKKNSEEIVLWYN
ncbi:DUF4362 domain-containing protein [Bacillus sp. Marseille-Q1617]|uniref:DUF4362 domain-containing protein n=1 Tax=Bacillus sp. Marseille-Q1617 TaxID=2736887 RepID=UPI0020CA3B91|nr:DUF4362 domain-containing protein [Bacillus sp. Marseille-Q1617]